jgi:chromate transporter
VLPPLVVLLVAGFYRRYGDLAAMQGFVRGLSLVVIGIFAVVLFGIMRTAGFNTPNLLIALGAMGLGVTRRVPVLGVLTLAALVGIGLYL